MRRKFVKSVKAHSSALTPALEAIFAFCSLQSRLYVAMVADFSSLASAQPLVVDTSPTVPVLIKVR